MQLAHYHINSARVGVIHSEFSQSEMLTHFFVKHSLDGDAVVLKALIQIWPKLLTLNSRAFDQVAGRHY